MCKKEKKQRHAWKRTLNTTSMSPSEEIKLKKV